MAEEYTQDYTGNGEDQYQESMEVNQAMGEGEMSEGQSPGDRINASKNDDDERYAARQDGKIFVGGLSWETTVKDLREYFEKYGTVLDCTLKTDPATNRSRGFGFVLFGESTTVDKVLAEKSHLLHGRNIDPKRAKARGGREPILKVFVGGLDPNIPESDIRTYFEKFGKVTDVDLPFDKQKNQRRAFCFVSFESEEVVDKVCAEAKQEIVEGKKVDVKKATPKNEQYGGYGAYGYGGGYGAPPGRGRGGFRGRGRGGGYNQGNNWSNYDYNNYYGNNQGYDYNSYYNQGYGNYDYNNYYGQGWGNYNYNQGYGNYGNGYDYSGWGYGTDNQGGGNQSGGNGYGGGKTKRGGGSTATTSSNNSHGYHPYSR